MQLSIHPLTFNCAPHNTIKTIKSIQFNSIRFNSIDSIQLLTLPYIAPHAVKDWKRENNNTLVGSQLGT